MSMQKQTSPRQKDAAPLLMRLLLGATLVWLALLAVTLAVTLHFALSTLERKVDESLTTVAGSLADSEMVMQAVAAGACPVSLRAYLDDLVAHSVDMDVLTVADAGSIRLYHVVPERVGLPFSGNDQGPALAGESYLTQGEGSLGLQRRAFAPVRAADGRVVGFVMAGATLGQMEALQSEIVHTYILMAVLLLGMTLLLTWGGSRLLRRRFHGLTTRTLVHAYLTQNQMLDNLEEGVLAVDSTGRVQLANRAAERMLGQRAERLEQSTLDSLLRAENDESLLQCVGEDISTTRPNILCSCVPMEKEEGVTLILKDKSDALRRARQLIGTRHIVSALRASTHEYMNMLQVISGLLQMDRRQEALDYIGAISASHAQATGPVLQTIQNPNVAALLLGKLGNMRELDIRLTLLPDSSLPAESGYLSTAELVTVVGNLVENAIEAVNARCDREERNVVLQITESASSLLVMVSDTGVGIEPGQLEQIFRTGYSTKADKGRGVGMGLIQNIVTRHGGSIEVDSEPGSGTTVTLIFGEKASWEAIE